ncbi:MAG TPA: VOC family protein [Gemmatimonadetes bacterium]|jgi:catechol 2,3-dioxygenase-like lactoylglutathione lyase family enzyme|nr:VOC family protein [Gemmatimonadota bacterium]
MENIIATMVEDFENGKVNRRQLIRNLALAVVGVHSAATPSSLTAETGSSKDSQAVFETAELDHISYAVSDYGRSRDFYNDLMGWEVRSDNGENQASLAIGDVGNIIIRNNRQSMNQTAGRGDRPPLTGVINHISWRLKDFDTDAVREELESRGLNPRRDQAGGEGYDSYHVLDPDGWDLQIAK